MRKILPILGFLMCGIHCSVAGNADAKQRPRVAVVLSGGGAKGMAHIGALRVIERAGIPIDIITGTSMGSIVGGLYSIGYDAEYLDSMVRDQNWTFLLSDMADMTNQSLADRKRQNTYILSREINLKHRSINTSGLVQGKNLMSLFNKLTKDYADSIDFNNLPIPFACVATDIVDNSEYDFHSGRLALAMRASMSIPGVFTPVRIGDNVLVDGGLRNNFPVDIARAMGADYVIGVTVQSPSKTVEDLDEGASVLGQIVDINCKNKYDDNLSHTDIAIKVNTHGYSAASFFPAAIDTLIQRGEDEATAHWDELLKLKSAIGLPYNYTPKKTHLQKQQEISSRLKVRSITFEEVDTADQRFLMKKYRLSRVDSIDYDKIDQIITSMRVDLFYCNASTSYQYHSDDSYDVSIIGGDKQTSRINIGVRFDTEEMVALQVGGSLLLNTKQAPLDAELVLRLGKRIVGEASINVTPLSWGKIGMTYTFLHNDINFYTEGERESNITYNSHQVSVSLFNFNIRNFNFTIGPRFELYDYRDVLLGKNVNADLSNTSSQHFFVYKANINYNSEKSWNFPTGGVVFNAGYGYYTDDLVHYKKNNGISAVNASWRMSFPLTTRLTFQPMVYGRLLFGKEIPFIISNCIGGNWFSHYLYQQMPFAGVGYIEHTDNHIIALQLRLQEQFAANNYIIVKLAAAQHSGKLNELFDKGPITGCQLAYCYDMFLGPIGASIGYSTKTHGAYFYINLGFEF